MSTKLTIRMVGEVTIIDSEGRITLGEGSSSLRAVISDLAQDGHKKIILNMAETTYYRQFWDF